MAHETESQNLESSSEKELGVHPYFIENNTNVQSIPTKLPQNVWNKLVPSSTMSAIFPQVGVDVTSIYQDPHEGAQDLLRQCGLTPSSISTSLFSSFFPLNESLSQQQYDETLQHLEHCLATFQNAIPDPSILSSCSLKTLCKAKIVSSRGAGGIKCPRWHTDCVPLRLIMSLEGPGVCYFKDLNALQTNTVLRNQYFNYDERQAKTGDAMLVMGKMWQDMIQQKQASGTTEFPPLQAAVHKSPDITQSQGRVLLTVDVVLEEEDFY